ncbi:hypothetical protein Lal_00042335 [Lupinus albus]|nr:hypothetical protein Lal_00042335 [Lupinus albus]
MAQPPTPPGPYTNFVYVSEHLVAENTAYEHSNSVHYVAFPDFYHCVHYENMAKPPTPPGPRERTFREQAAPDYTYDSLCIQYEDEPYVLKTGLIHLLPKFNGIAVTYSFCPPERPLRELDAPDFTYDSLCIQYEGIPYVLKTGVIHLLPKLNGLADSVHSIAFPDFYHSVHSENMAQPPTPPDPRKRKLRELAAPDYTYDSLCIQYVDVPYVLKTGLIHLLPKFNGLAGQDPHKHLKESHSVHSENMAQPPNPPGPYQSWKSRLSERFSPERERITWDGEILGYKRELSRLGEKWQFWAVDTV